MEENISFESIEESPHQEIDPGLQRLAIAVIMLALDDLERTRFFDDAKRFLAGSQALRFWLAVAGIIDDIKI